MLYVLIAVFAVFTLLRMCGMPIPGFQTPAEPAPSGYLMPEVLVGSVAALLTSL